MKPDDFIHSKYPTPADKLQEYAKLSGLVDEWLFDLRDALAQDLRKAKPNRTFPCVEKIRFSSDRLATIYWDAEDDPEGIITRIEIEYIRG